MIPLLADTADSSLTLVGALVIGIGTLATVCAVLFWLLINTWKSKFEDQKLTATAAEARTEKVLTALGAVVASNDSLRAVVLAKVG